MKTILAGLALMFGAAAMSGCSPTAEIDRLSAQVSGQGTVSGHVTTGGCPASSLRIQCKSVSEAGIAVHFSSTSGGAWTSTRTDQAGAYTIRLASGSYTAWPAGTCTAGHACSAYHIQLNAGDHRTLDLVDPRATIALPGRG